MKKDIYRAIDPQTQDVSNLSEDGHTHVEADITDLSEHDAEKIQGINVHTAAPTDGQVLQYVAGNTRYEPTTPPSGGGIPFFAAFTAPPTSGWSWDNQGSATITDQTADDAGLYLEVPCATTQQLHIRHRAAPATPYTVEMAFQFHHLTYLGEMGAIWREASSGKVNLIGFQGDFDRDNIVWRKWTNSTTYGSEYFSPEIQFTGGYGGIVWLKLEDDGTNLKFYVSFNGINFIHYDQDVLRGDDFTTAPDQIGFGIFPRGAATGVLDAGAISLLHWKEA